MVKARPGIRLGCKREQLFARQKIDLVEDQDLGLTHFLQPREDRLRLFVDPLAGIDQQADGIGIPPPRPRPR